MAEATKEDNPTTEQQAVIDEIATWIDTKVIALVIAEELVDQEQEVTARKCRAVWHGILEELHSLAEAQIQELK